MRNSNISFRLMIFCLSILLFLSGCHSYYEVSKDDYSNLEKMNDIKIVYKNGKEFVVEKDDTTNIKMVGDSLVVVQGKEIKFIGLGELENIKESRSDLGGILVMTILMATFCSVIFFLADLF